MKSLADSSRVSAKAFPQAESALRTKSRPVYATAEFEDKKFFDHRVQRAKFVKNHIVIWFFTNFAGCLHRATAQNSHDAFQGTLLKSMNHDAKNGAIGTAEALWFP